MPKYVLSLLVKSKFKNLLSVFCYRLSRFRDKGQNQRVATSWRYKSIEIDRLNLKLVSIWGPFRSKSETRYQSSNAWISSWNAQMFHFPLCPESVLGMPRIEINFVVVVFLFFVFCCCCCCCFSTRIYLQHIARPVQSDRPIKHRVCPSVRSSVVSLWM